MRALKPQRSAMTRLVHRRASQPYSRLPSEQPPPSRTTTPAHSPLPPDLRRRAQANEQPAPRMIGQATIDSSHRRQIHNLRATSNETLPLLPAIRSGRAARLIMNNNARATTDWSSDGFRANYNPHEALQQLEEALS